MAIQTQGVTRITDPGVLQNLTNIKTVNGSSILGATNLPVATAGTGTSVSGTTITNTGVLTINGQAGAVTLSGGLFLPQHTDVGAYAFVITNFSDGSPDAIFDAGVINPGSFFYYGGIFTSAGMNIGAGAVPPGTWRMMGYIIDYSGPAKGALVIARVA